MSKMIGVLNPLNWNHTRGEQQEKDNTQMLMERFKIQHDLSKTVPASNDIRSCPGFGRYIRAARSNKGFTLEELAIETKIPYKMLVMIEEGFCFVQQIRDEWIYRLASVLEEDVSRLYLLLGLPIQASPEESKKGVLDKVRCYLNDGWSGSRSRHRPYREPRDPNRLYFDK
jgi:transcriptional regulator with XRE-family HTH domain